MKQTPVKLGPLALLLAVICICLTALALLNFSTARADMRLAETFADTVRTRYLLETEGQELLASLGDSQSLSDWETDSSGIHWKVLEHDQFRLRIGLRDTGGEKSVVCWTQEKEWEQDTHIANLWTGG